MCYERECTGEGVKEPVAAGYRHVLIDKQIMLGLIRRLFFSVEFMDDLQTRCQSTEHHIHGMLNGCAKAFNSLCVGRLQLLSIVLRPTLIGAVAGAFGLRFYRRPCLDSTGHID